MRKGSLTRSAGSDVEDTALATPLADLVEFTDSAHSTAEWDFMAGPTSSTLIPPCTVPAGDSGRRMLLPLIKTLPYVSLLRFPLQAIKLDIHPPPVLLLVQA